MPPPVYSERLLFGRATGATQAITVPAGRRVVVRYAVFQAFAGGADYFLFRINGTSVIYHHEPGPWALFEHDVRCVAYQGEQLEVITDGGDVTWHISGYLFSDT